MHPFHQELKISFRWRNALYGSATRAQAGHMVKDLSNDALIIDLTQNQSHEVEVEYTEDGAWNVLSNN